MKYAIIPCLALSGLLLVSCATTSFSYPESHVVPDDFFGISPDRSPLEAEDFALLDDFNAVWIRTTLHWDGVERKEGTWDFSHWDAYVDKAVGAGKKIVFILGFDNSWLYNDHREHRDFTEREIAYFLQYVEKVVDRYRGRVAAFEIWNEPNFVFWKGSDKHFFALSAAAAKKIREIDPEVTILAGSLFRVGEGFVRGMFKSGAMENTDGISLHPYSSDALYTVKQIDKLRRLLAEYNYTGQIWVTEVGYATGGIYFSTVNDVSYPEYIVKTLSGLAARGIRNLIWYELMDNYTPDTIPNHWNPSYHFGLIYPDGTLKNGAAAFMLCGKYLRGAEYMPELPGREALPDSITSLYFKKGDTSILLLWNNNRGKKKVRLNVPGVEGLEKYSIITGESERLAPGSQLTLTKEPLFITWTGGDYLRSSLSSSQGLRASK
jgi:hypothetical protein